ncbi:MAG: ABC transporter permease subunit [Clostridiales bacterium]|nr:ABC transporter permease subunit [Clostridiales bacterium]
MVNITTIKKDFKRNWVVYLIALPVVVFFAVFAYAPMVGVLMAFQNYQIKGGFLGSPWIGLKNFTDFFKSYYFGRLIWNTFILSFYDLLFGFPAPILFALLMNELRSVRYKRVVQTITYMPYFISIVVIAGIIKDFFSSNGAITLLLGSTSNLIGNVSSFRSIFVGTNIWQFLGFNSVIYMAALSGVDQELYDAAALDGAGRLGKALHVTLPSIMSTIIILLILRIGNLLTVSFEKILLLYAPSTYSVSDVITTFTYRKGLLESNYGYSTAVGLFNSALNFLMLVTANFTSKKLTETSLF